MTHPNEADAKEVAEQIIALHNDPLSSIKIGVSHKDVLRVCIRLLELESSVKQWEAEDTHEAMSCYLSHKELDALKAELQKEITECNRLEIKTNKLEVELKAARDENFRWQSMEHNKEVMKLRQALASISDDDGWCGNEARDALRPAQQCEGESLT